VNVWAVMVHYDYEGAELVALYGTREAAVARVLVEAPQEEDYEWTDNERKDGTYERYRGATRYTAHEEEVLG
jgi:hypothetical protein